MKTKAYMTGLFKGKNGPWWSTGTLDISNVAKKSNGVVYFTMFKNRKKGKNQPEYVLSVKASDRDADSEFCLSDKTENNECVDEDFKKMEERYKNNLRQDTFISEQPLGHGVTLKRVINAGGVPYSLIMVGDYEAWNAPMSGEKVMIMAWIFGERWRDHENSKDTGTYSIIPYAWEDEDPEIVDYIKKYDKAHPDAHFNDNNLDYWERMFSEEVARRFMQWIG